MLNIVVNLCLLVLRPNGSMVLQYSLIMSAPGILWSTLPVPISGGRYWKAPALVWNLLSLLSRGPEVVWWRLLLRKIHSWLSDWQQAVSWAVFTPLSCFPQSRCNSLAFRTSDLLRLLLDLDTYGGVDPMGVYPLFLKKVADIIAQNYA